jgi:hypothetical protein
MFHAINRSAIASAALFLQSAAPTSALTNVEVNGIGERALTLNCSDGWRLKADDMAVACAIVMTIIIRDFEERGYMGHEICPAHRTRYNEMFDAITDYLIAERPEWTGRTVDTAFDALMRKYPCSRQSGKRR